MTRAEKYLAAFPEVPQVDGIPIREDGEPVCVRLVFSDVPCHYGGRWTQYDCEDCWREEFDSDG